MRFSEFLEDCLVFRSFLRFLYIPRYTERTQILQILRDSFLGLLMMTMKRRRTIIECALSYPEVDPPITTFLIFVPRGTRAPNHPNTLVCSVQLNCTIMFTQIHNWENAHFVKHVRRTALQTCASMKTCTII